MKLNLGCGLDRRAGYVNCDISPKVNPDRIVDLEKKLPFRDNSVDEINLSHVLEHVRNLVPLMHELRRICKNGAKIHIRVPFYSSWSQFTDPTHVRFFTPRTFDYFQKGKLSHEVGAGDKNLFIARKVKITFFFGKMSFLNPLIDPLINLSQTIYCRLFAWIFPASEIVYELEVVK
jgi:SAM-dependent methyltransferase